MEYSNWNNKKYAMPNYEKYLVSNPDLHMLELCNSLVWWFSHKYLLLLDIFAQILINFLHIAKKELYLKNFLSISIDFVEFLSKE